jgi:predicted dehydrogenase
MKGNKITMLGSGLIGTFYTMTLHQQRGRDRVQTVYSRSEDRAKEFAKNWDIPNWETDMKKAIRNEDSNVVVVALPNNLHKEAILLAAEAGKDILCTKPLGRNAAEAKEILEAVEKAGVFHGYLEDLAYTPKTLKSLESVKNGAIGDVLWTRSREAHPGPHSDWFWDPEQSGGGAIIDMGCHCIEIGRNFIGKDIKPVKVMCWAATMVKPIAAEDNAIGLIEYENGAISQFEVSWTYRGGMDLRDEVAGTKGNIRLDHFLRTGFEMYSDEGQKDYVAEKVEKQSGWLFPVGDEVHALGYTHMFTDMFDAMDENRKPMEDFYDGYIVNEIMDACYRSANSGKWEPVELAIWRGKTNVENLQKFIDYDEQHYLIKEEKLPDGRDKVIIKNKETGAVSEKILTKKQDAKG